MARRPRHGAMPERAEPMQRQEARTRPEPGRELSFDPEVLLKQKQKELCKRIKAILNGETDGRVVFKGLNEPKFKPKASVLWEYFKKNRLYAHPFRLFRALTTAQGPKSIWAKVGSTKEGGTIKFMRDKARYKTFKRLWETKLVKVEGKGKIKYKPAAKGGQTFKQMFEEIEKELSKDVHDVFNAFKKDVESGRVNAGNYGTYLDRYERDMEKARHVFIHKRNEVLTVYENMLSEVGPFGRFRSGLPKYPENP